MATIRCVCRCHRVPYLTTVSPDVRDVLEAAVACAVCIDSHCPAITADWPWPYDPRGGQPPLGSADGYPYDPADPQCETD